MDAKLVKEAQRGPIQKQYYSELWAENRRLDLIFALHWRFKGAAREYVNWLEKRRKKRSEV